MGDIQIDLAQLSHTELQELYNRVLQEVRQRNQTMQQ